MLVYVIDPICVSLAPLDVTVGDDDDVLISQFVSEISFFCPPPPSLPSVPALSSPLASSLFISESLLSPRAILACIGEFPFCSFLLRPRGDVVVDDDDNGGSILIVFRLTFSPSSSLFPAPPTPTALPLSP